MATPESKVKTAVKRVLKDFGIHHFMPMQNGFGVVGVSDIIGCWNGWYIAIETKAPGKKGTLTANQRNFLQQIERNGGLALVIDDAQELRKILVDILNLRKEQAANVNQKIQVQESAREAQLQEGVRPGSVKPGEAEVPSGAEQKESGEPSGGPDEEG